MTMKVRSELWIDSESERRRCAPVRMMTESEISKFAILCTVTEPLRREAAYIGMEFKADASSLLVALRWELDEKLGHGPAFTPALRALLAPIAEYAAAFGCGVQVAWAECDCFASTAKAIPFSLATSSVRNAPWNVRWQCAN